MEVTGLGLFLWRSLAWSYIDDSGSGLFPCTCSCGGRLQGPALAEFVAWACFLGGHSLVSAPVEVATLGLL